MEPLPKYHSVSYGTTYLHTHGVYIHGVPFGEWNYYLFNKGIGGWTKYPKNYEDNGPYYSFYLKPCGRGSRSGASRQYVYVPRSTGQRQSKKACKLRSYNLAMGLPISTGVVSKPKIEHPPGSGYCLVCKQIVHLAGLQDYTASTGRSMISGTCPYCLTNIKKYGRLIECPECNKHSEGQSDDYLCKACRADY